MSHGAMAVNAALALLMTHSKSARIGFVFFSPLIDGTTAQNKWEIFQWNGVCLLPVRSTLSSRCVEVDIPFFLAKLQSYACVAAMVELILNPKYSCIGITRWATTFVCAVRGRYDLFYYDVCVPSVQFNHSQNHPFLCVCVCCWCYLTAVCHFVIVAHKFEMVPSPDHVLSQAVVVVLSLFSLLFLITRAFFSQWNVKCEWMRIAGCPRSEYTTTCVCHDCWWNGMNIHKAQA